MVTTTVALYGMVKRTSWARMMAFGVVVFEVLLTLGGGIYLQSVLLGEGSTYILISSLIFAVFFLFLAYKLYISDGLKTYLSS
jgi:hypothetical protein